MVRKKKAENIKEKKKRNGLEDRRSDGKMYIKRKKNNVFIHLVCFTITDVHNKKTEMFLVYTRKYWCW